MFRRVTDALSFSAKVSAKFIARSEFSESLFPLKFLQQKIHLLERGLGVFIV
jgi:hypothetical protein